MTTVTNAPENFLDDNGNLVFYYNETKISMRKGNGKNFWILAGVNLGIWMHYIEKDNLYVYRVFEMITNQYNYSDPNPSVAFAYAVNNYKEWEISQRESNLLQVLSGK